MWIILVQARERERERGEINTNLCTLHTYVRQVQQNASHKLCYMITNNLNITLPAFKELAANSM